MITSEHDPSPSAPTPQFSSSNQPSETGSVSRSRRLLALAGTGALLITAFVLYKVAVPAVGESETVQGERTRTIQLDVLNATGESRLAQRLTDHLRRKGFDVVEMGNYREGVLEKTLVVDRGGNKQAALQVAGALGIPDRQVIEKRDNTLYLDVTVIIGKDFRTLSPFK